MDILKQLHTSIANSFESSFDYAYGDLNIELTRRDTRFKEAEEAAQAAGEAHRSSAARVEELERKVKILKEELHPCEVDPKSRQFSVSMQTTYGPEHVLEYLDCDSFDGLHPDIKAQFTEIGIKYRTLYEYFQDVIRVCGTLRTKVDSHKQKLVQWQDRIAREEFTIELSGTPTKFQRVQAISDTKGHYDARTEAADLNQSKFTMDKDLHVQGHRNLNDPENVPTIPPNVGLPDPRSDLSFPSDKTVSNGCSSDTSAGTVMQQSKRKRVSLSEPDTVSSSSLEPILTKSESMSSSPLRNLPEYRPPVGTQDLDEIGSSVETPTKKNRHNPGSRKRQHFTTTNAFEVARELEDDHKNERHSGRATSKRSRILKPVDINVRTVNFSDKRLSSKSRSSERTSEHAIPSITEDGESYANNWMPKRIERRTPSITMEQPLRSTQNKSIQQRLQSLLEGPSPSRSPLNVQGNTVDNRDDSSRGSHGADEQSPISKIRAVRTEKPRLLQQTMQNSGMKAGAEGPEQVRLHREPYRSLPLERLEPTHFKINPDYNHGLDFAYDTVVRKKDECKCMTGCTRRGCCGDIFLAMARVGGLPTNIAGPNQEAEEQKILEEYLGEDKHLLDTLDPQDRENLLREAHPRHIANVYGKHRENHQRARTPPGFWRTDMPDTQELEHDHEEARNLEREKVYERYREARRPGGLWKFADE